MTTQPATISGIQVLPSITGDATTTARVDGVFHVLLLVGVGSGLLLGVLLALDPLGAVLVELAVLLLDLFLAALCLAASAGTVTQRGQHHVSKSELRALRFVNGSLLRAGFAVHAYGHS